MKRALFILGLALSGAQVELHAQSAAGGDLVRLQKAREVSPSRAVMGGLWPDKVTRGTLPSGDAGQNWRLSLRQGQEVQIDAVSDQFDTYLEIFRGNETSPLAANDDNDVGASTNSRLRFLAPSSGVYFVSVRGTIAKIAGDYELLVRPRKSTVAPCNIQLGQTIKSDLEDIEDSKNYARSCFFSGQSGQRVSIAMNAAEFDSVLELRHGDRLIASDDDSGGGQNALLVKTLPATGTYEIRATTLSLESKKQVGFTLSLNALKQPKSVVEIDHVTVGTAETGRFTDDNVVGPDERPYALYQLSGRAREGFIVLVDWTDPAMQKARVGTLRLQVGANTPIGFASARASTASPINPLTIPINFDTDGTLLLRISSTPGRQGEYRLSVSRQVESTGVAGPS